MRQAAGIAPVEILRRNRHGALEGRAHLARLGAARTFEHPSDFIRIGAELDCQNGRYEQGVDVLETLMKGKNWSVPPLPRS